MPSEIIINQNLVAKFLARVEYQPLTGCWHWQASRNKDGYGLFYHTKKKKVKAHRFSYTIYIGDLPNNMVVRHECNNPICCSPFHIKIGTYKENMEDKVRRGRVPKHYKKTCLMEPDICL